VTTLGDPEFRIALVALVTGVLAWRRAWRPAIFLVVAAVGGAEVVSLLKSGIARARPDFLPHLDVVRNASMPSGHSANGTIAWLGSALALGTIVPRRRLLIAGALGIALLIGVSRLALAVHWPSDVLVGWAIGLCWTLALWWVFDPWARGATTSRGM
jgi:undecaprenyl-diphosphatase